MNPDLYRAAMNGNIDVLKYLSQLETQLTPNRNTALHIVALFGKLLCATKILRNRSSLLLSRNKKGETAFHIAAREGHTETVVSLIEFAKTELSDWVNDMMRLTNDEGNTALHDAVRFEKLDVVKVLVREDLEFLHPLNKAEETPLYLAAENRLVDFVHEILKNCKSASYIGPLNRTAMHAAVIFPSIGCIEELLLWKPSLLKKTDSIGWAPIHFAAFLGHSWWVLQMLLDTDASLAYLPENNERKMPPLHLAASKRHLYTVRRIIDRFPDCWDSVDGKSRNVLHIAIGNKQTHIVAFLLENPMMSSLINQKDSEGNTPLHVNSTMLGYSNIIELARDPRVVKNIYNNENLTPLDLAIREAPGKYVEKIIDQLKEKGASLGFRNKISFHINSNIREFLPSKPLDSRKIVESHMIVGALIVTIAFTAGFTIPGGYNGDDGPDQGTAVLAKRVAFKAFMISDTIALLLSTLALVMHFAASVASIGMVIHNFMESAASLITVALGAMMVTFVTGTYVMLERQSVTLAIAICVIGCCFFPVYLVVVPNVFQQIWNTMYFVSKYFDRLKDLFY